MKKYAVVIFSLLVCSPLLAEAKRGSYTHGSSYANSHNHQKTNKDKEKKESWTTVSNLFIDTNGRVFWIKTDDTKKK